MLDSVLKYVSLITVAGAAISFGVLMGRVSAEAGSPGHKLALTQQIAAIYELQHFMEYSYASMPILEHLREVFTDPIDPRSSPLIAAIDDTLKALRQ